MICMLRIGHQLQKKIYENEDFGAELNKTGYFDDLNRLLTGLKTPYEKLTRFIILLRPT
jgi:hypothetical protein